MEKEPLKGTHVKAVNCHQIFKIKANSLEKRACLKQQVFHKV